MVYVGSSDCSIANRVSQHSAFLRYGRHSDCRLQQIFDENSGEIMVEVLEYCAAEECRDRELHWQEIYPTGQRKVRGFKLDARTRLRLRDRQLEVSSRPGQLERRKVAASKGHEHRDPSTYNGGILASHISGHVQSNNASGCPGVGKNSRDPTLWYAYVTVDKKRRVLGTRFASFEEAVAARQRYAGSGA